MSWPTHYADVDEVRNANVVSTTTTAVQTDEQQLSSDTPDTPAAAPPPPMVDSTGRLFFARPLPFESWKAVHNWVNSAVRLAEQILKTGLSSLSYDTRMQMMIGECVNNAYQIESLAVTIMRLLGSDADRQHAMQKEIVALQKRVSKCSCGLSFAMGKKTNKTRYTRFDK